MDIGAVCDFELFDDVGGLDISVLADEPGYRDCFILTID